MKQRFDIGLVTAYLWCNARVIVAYVLLFSFLALTVWHTQHVLAAFEEVKEAAWLLAVGLDAGIAFASFVALDRLVGRGSRVIAGVWLGGLIIASYGLNVAYYAGKNAGLWSWALAALFPASLAFLGAIMPGLKPVLRAETFSQQNMPVNGKTPTESLPMAKPFTLPADNGKSNMPTLPKSASENMPFANPAESDYLPMAKPTLPSGENAKNGNTENMPFANGEQSENLPMAETGNQTKTLNLPFEEEGHTLELPTSAENIGQEHWFGDLPMAKEIMPFSAKGQNQNLDNYTDGKVLHFPADSGSSDELPDSDLAELLEDSGHNPIYTGLSKAARAVQQKNLKITEFDVLLTRLWAEAELPLTDNAPGEICRWARLLQRREIRVKEFDQNLAELLAKIGKA